MFCWFSFCFFYHYRSWHECWYCQWQISYRPCDYLCLHRKCFQFYSNYPFCIRTLKLQRVELSRPPHIKDLRLFGEHMLCGWEQFANCGVINKTNKLCKDTDINHRAAGGRKSLFDCLSEFQFGRATTERLSVSAEYTSGPVRSRVSGRLAFSPQLQLYVWVSRDSSIPHPVHTKPQNRLSLLPAQTHKPQGLGNRSCEK